MSVSNPPTNTPVVSKGGNNDPLWVQWFARVTSAINTASATVSTAWGKITGTLSDQKDLQAALDAKANTSALNGLATTDYVNSAVAGAKADSVPTTRTINTTAPLTGGGDLSADRTLAIDAFTGDSGSGGAKGAVPAPAAGDAAAGKYLKADGTWETVAGFTNPMTTLGDTMYEDSTPTAARLAGNTTSTKKFLTQTGTGSVSAAPGWNTIAAADVPSGLFGADLASLTATTQKVVGILDKAIDASSPTDGQLPQYQSATGKWELVYVYQKSQGGVAGSPSASQPMCWANIIQPVAFAADFAGSQGMIDPGVGANPAATVTLTVKKWVSGVATTLGTISISTGGVFTFATTSHAAQSAGTGDLVAVYNQNPADASLAYPTFALAGYLGSTAPTNPIVSGGAVSGPVSSTNNDIALFDGTPGNVIKDSGVQISTDGTMASNSDSLVPTQKAVVTYIGANATRGWQLLEQHTASSSSSLDFTSISSSYDTYVFEFVSLVPATNAANLTLVAGTGAGPSWDTTSGHYKWDVLELFSGSTGSSFPAGSDSAANILLSPGLLSAGNTFTGNGQVILYNPQSSTTYKHVVLDYSGPDSNHSTNFAVFKGGGAFVQTTAMTGVRFIMTSGAIASGTIRMYGLAK